MKKNRNHSPRVDLNLNVRDLGVSATLAIQELSNRLRAEGKSVLRMGLGQSPFPVPDPVVEALRANAHQRDYLPVRGLMRLREAVAEYHHRMSHLPCSGEDVLVGPGSKELMFLLQLVYYGDLLIPAPSWVSYAPQARIIGRQVQWIDTSEHFGYRIMPEDLEAECCRDPGRPRILVLNYPNNPTGLTYRVEELKALARVAREHKVILLSDEIYGELHHRGQHVSISRFYPEGTILSGGLSKWCGAGGWRLGVFVFPQGLRWLLEAMAVVASETYTSTSAPIQYAAVRAFQGGSAIESYLRQVRRILRTVGRVCARRLESMGARVSPPEGAFYLFPNFAPVADRLARRGILTSADLCRLLLEEAGVAALPGEAFGRPPQELTVRMAYVDFDGARALAAAKDLKEEEPLGEEFLTTYCGNVMAALDGIEQWLANQGSAHV
ncbi:MAG: aminotransferase class I/II-fold pyridoxal phosphate-dependent enzyme [Bradymonadales bacterium]|nr:aminotransferase class I/II-fold pyridoxal phosphate-dependent enzyme [Bradymonadales bacterium]